MALWNLQTFDDADDALETAGGEVVLENPLWLTVGASTPVVGMIFHNVSVPPGSTVTVTLFDPVDIHPDHRAANLEVLGEGNPAAFAETTHNLSGRTMTAAAVNWVGTVHEDDYSPDLSAVVQEIVDDSGWEAGDSLALFWIDRGMGGDLWFTGASVDGLLLILEWTPPDSWQEFAWPEDYWLPGYWAEYWPDYGTGLPPTAAVPASFMYFQRLRRGRG